MNLICKCHLQDFPYMVKDSAKALLVFCFIRPTPLIYIFNYLFLILDMQ